MNGIPPLTAKQLRQWQQVLPRHYEELTEDCRRGRQTLLDCYGTTSLAEFFAVATECFFELPHEMREFHPELYAVLGEFFQQDPASRIPPIG